MFFAYLRTSLIALLIGVMSSMVLPGATSAQENPAPAPIELPCATNVSAQLLGASPVGDGSQTLVLARVIFAPEGSIGEHIHPGSLVVTVESGTFGFTHLGDQEMTLNRAATSEREASQEVLPHGEQITIEPGDWFVETGMIHTGANLSDGDTTVLLSGLIETGQPLTICADDTAASGQHSDTH